MVRNVIVVLWAVYDLSAERGGCRLYEMKGRSSCRVASGHGHVDSLHDCNRMASKSLVVDIHPHSSDMTVFPGSSQVPDAMAVDREPKLLAMAVH
jgi:hypothetical protein